MRFVILSRSVILRYSVILRCSVILSAAKDLFFLIFLPLASTAALACPETPSGPDLINLFINSTEVTSVQFLKIESEGSSVNAWRFKVSATLKPANAPLTGKVSFFSKPGHAVFNAPRFNDRYLAFITKKTVDLPFALKNYFFSPEDESSTSCIYRSSIYLEDLLKKSASVEAVRDGTCKIQLKNLEAAPLIKEALKFRCENPDLEKKRLVLLANAYASAKRYGNAVTALEMSNGTLNAYTLSITLGWADEWEVKDDRAAKRFVERILTSGLRGHMEKTRQLPAVNDILNDKSRFRRLRDTDWFTPLLTNWIANNFPAVPNPLEPPKKLPLKLRKTP